MDPSMRRWRWLGLTAATMVALAGCSGDDTAGGDAGGGDGEAAADGATVTVVDFDFSPPTLTVAAGTVVRFTNQDGVAHTATGDDGGFDLPLGAGVEATASFDEPGNHPYHCEIHPRMTGEIVVE